MLRKLSAWGFQHTEHITACSLEMAYSVLSQDISESVFRYISQGWATVSPFNWQMQAFLHFREFFFPILLRIIACSSVLSSLYGISLTSTLAFPVYSPHGLLSCSHDVCLILFLDCKLFLSSDFPSH